MGAAEKLAAPIFLPAIRRVSKINVCHAGPERYFGVADPLSRMLRRIYKPRLTLGSSLMETECCQSYSAQPCLPTRATKYILARLSAILAEA
jgi:hypothetical protein